MRRSGAQVVALAAAALMTVSMRSASARNGEVRGRDSGRCYTTGSALLVPFLRPERSQFQGFGESGAAGAPLRLGTRSRGSGFHWSPKRGCGATVPKFREFQFPYCTVATNTKPASV